MCHGAALARMQGKRRPWQVAGQNEITRAAIFALRERLTAPAVKPEPVPVDEARAPVPALKTTRGETVKAITPAKTVPAVVAGQTAKFAPGVPVVMAEFKGQPLVLDVATVPPTRGHFYGRRPGSTRRLMVAAADLKLTGFEQR